MLASIFRALLLRRLFESASRRSSRRSGYGRSRMRGGRGRGRGNVGMWGPFPSYSRRTRGGSQVRVTGCCLPIPLALALTPAAAYGLRRRATTR